MPPTPTGRPAIARPSPGARTHPGAVVAPRPGRAWRRSGTLLLLLVLLLLALLLPAAAQKSAPVQAPSPASAAAPAASGVPGAAPAAASVSTLAAAPLEFTPADLPVARVGVRYGPLPLVRNGAGVTVFDIVGDIADSGLEVSGTALLQGVPTQAGRYRFTVTLVGAAGVSTPLRQAFHLRVLAPRSARAAPPAVAAASAPALPSPLRVPRSMTENLPTLSEAPHGRIWKITAADLKALAEAATLAAAKEEEKLPDGFPGQAPSDAAVAAGTRVQTNLAALLTPMLDVEFPSYETFEAALISRQRLAGQALISRQRLACLKLAGDRARELGQKLDPRVCGGALPLDTVAPAAVRSAPAGACVLPGKTGTDPAGDLLTPEQTLEAVLPKPQRDYLLCVAERTHELAAAEPVRWSGGGCGCVELQQKNFIYGFVPFWQPQAGQVQQVDFSAYTRLGYIGAVLGEDGSVARSPHWNDPHADGLRAALRHGTGLDLVVYGRHWGTLLARRGSQRDDAVRRIAEELMQMVDTPLTGGLITLQEVALPGWPRAKHLYSGLTLFFDKTPETADFQSLLGEIIAALVNRMRRSDREYALNLVVPATRLGADGQVRTMESVRRLLERTGSITVMRSAGQDGASDAVTGPGVIKTRLFVLLNEPTTETKKDLRAALDRSEALQSHQRKDVLKSLVPVMSFAVAEKPRMMSSEEQFQFDADLVYYEWSFGGAALWPVPVAGRGTSDTVQALVLENFRNDTDWWQAQKRPAQALCGWVCPNRVWWRLALNVLLLTGVVSIGLFIWNCKVRGLGWTYVAGLIAGGVVTAIVYGVLLTCDPALDALRRGNATLFVVLALALAGSMALALRLRRKVAKP